MPPDRSGALTRLRGLNMNRWKLVVPLAGLVALVGCGGAPVAVQASAGPVQAGVGPAEMAPDAPPAEVVVNTAPPAEQIEVVPVQPTGDYVWIKGHWHWNGGGWAWIRGHYAVRRAGWRFVPAHYEARGGGWVYVGPHWAR
jgi:hypothetical protein